MKFLTGAVALVAGFLAPTTVLAAPSADPTLREVELEIRDGIESRAPPTCHSASNRACWTTGFNINTDYETTAPPPGQTRKYTLNITEHDNWQGPDGVVKQKVMLINGKFRSLPSRNQSWYKTLINQ